jgi:hypothetical protein
VGTLTMALQAAGPDGAIYRLPRADLRLNRQGNGIGSFPLGGTETVRSFTLPAGSYTGDAVARTPDSSWTLGRVNADGTESPVRATLTNPSVSFQIIAGQTTDLTLRFTLDRLGDVVFSTGTLDVRAEFGFANRQATHARLQLETLVQAGAQFAPNPGLIAFLDAPAGTPMSVTMDFTLSGVWDYYYQRVCTAATGRLSVNTGHAGLAALGSESSTAPEAQLCFHEVGSTTFVSVTLRRTGPPDSALSSVITGDHNFDSAAGGGLPGPVWNGQRLDLSGMLLPVALANSSAYVGIGAMDGSTVADIQLQVTTAAVSMTP